MDSVRYREHSNWLKKGATQIEWLQEERGVSGEYLIVREMRGVAITESKRGSSNTTVIVRIKLLSPTS